jgi:hypothetical protein
MFDVMKTDKYTLTREQFDRLAPDERVFFTQMLHFLNEIWIVQKTVLISNKGLTKVQEPVRGAHIAQSFFLIKMQAGILYEAWHTIEQSYGKLDKEHHYQIPQTSRDSLAALKKYFNNPDNLVKYIRHKHSFHCDQERIADGIDAVSKKDNLEILVAEDGGNFFCQLSETMANVSLLRFAHSEDVGEAFKKLLQEVLIDVVGWVTHFAHGFCATVCATLGASPDEIDLPNVATLSTLDLPYFIRRDE